MTPESKYNSSEQKEKGVVSRMKQRHIPDARAYHEYYLNQAGRGYPVYVGKRYQRGHGLGSIFGSLFKSAFPLLKKGNKPLRLKL
jgi:hypothetical protein